MAFSHIKIIRIQMSNVNIIEGKDLAGIIASNENVLINFSAAWCGPCKGMAPVLEQVATEYLDSLKVVKLDIDDAFEIAQLYNVRAVPTLIHLRNGEIVNQAIGAQTKGQLVKLITE